MSLTTIDRSVDPEKVTRYIATLDQIDTRERQMVLRELRKYETNEKDKEDPSMTREEKIAKATRIVQRVVENTVYIKQDQLLSSLRRSITRLEQIAPRYNLYIPNDKIGSEHWLILQLRDVLHPVQKFYGLKDIKQRLNNDYPIVLIDDAIYSSVHMCNIVEGDFRYDAQIKNKVYCVVAFTSSLNVPVTEYNAEIIADRNLEHLRADKLLGNDYDFYFLNEMFGCEYYPLPLYFDHKIANEFGSYQFYHQIIKNPVDRSPIDRVTEDEIENYVQS